MGGMAKISNRKLILQIKQPTRLKFHKTPISQVKTTEVVTTRQNQDCATARVCLGILKPNILISVFRCLTSMTRPQGDATRCRRFGCPQGGSLRDAVRCFAIDGSVPKGSPKDGDDVFRESRHSSVSRHIVPANEC